MATFVGTEDNNTLQGGDEDDLLQGLGGDDILDGGAGANTLEGGTDDDEFHVHSLADTVVENADEGRDTVHWDGVGLYTLAANVEYFYLEDGATQANGNELDNFMFADISVGGVNVTMDGAGGNDDMWGGANDDTLYGGDGDDSMDGGGGGDTMYGGAGNDFMIGESFSFGNGWDDNLFGGDGDDLLEGLDGNDTLSGGDGADTLDGYGGLDTMTGGAGADFYEMILSDYANGEDVIADFADGEDHILVAFDGLEPLDMSNVAAIVQNGEDTVITFTRDGSVTEGSFRLLLTDASTITADDFFFYMDGDPTDESIAGSANRDRLAGEAGDDTLDGRRGADQLIGGQGHDTLRGGAGADEFQFTLISDRGDHIVDFRAAKGDVIDISAIDANTHSAGDQAFHFVDGFDSHRGEATLVYRVGGDRTVLKLDVDGDAHADFKVVLDGHITSDAGWIL